MGMKGPYVLDPVTIKQKHQKENLGKRIVWEVNTPEASQDYFEGLLQYPAHPTLLGFLSRGKQEKLIDCL